MTRLLSVLPRFLPIAIVGLALVSGPAQAEQSASGSNKPNAASPSKVSKPKQRTKMHRRVRRRRAVDTRMIVSSPGFRMLRDGRSMLYVQILGTPTLQQINTPTRIVVTIPQAKVPVHNNRRTLLTRYFNTPVSDARLKQVKDDVQVVIDLRAKVQPTVKLRPVVQGKVSMLEIVFPAGHYYVANDDSFVIRGPRRPVRNHGTRRRSRRPTTYDRPGSSVLGPPSP